MQSRLAQQHCAECASRAAKYAECASRAAGHAADLVVQPKSSVEVLSVAQHLLKSFPAGVIIAGGHIELLHLLKLVYSAQQASLHKWPDARGNKEATSRNACCARLCKAVAGLQSADHHGLDKHKPESLLAWWTTCQQRNTWEGSAWQIWNSRMSLPQGAAVYLCHDCHLRAASGLYVLHRQPFKGAWQVAFGRQPCEAAW